MNECGVCGILYLAGGSCPACGSQIQKRSDDFQDADIVLPSEVPGLDEAADAWYDLEGIEKPTEEVEEELPSSSLPFGFGGESTTNVSRLPFGIGSHRDGDELLGQKIADYRRKKNGARGLLEQPKIWQFLSHIRSIGENTNFLKRSAQGEGFHLPARQEKKYSDLHKGPDTQKQEDGWFLFRFAR